MKGYPIIGVLWDDHITKVATEIPFGTDIDDELPTLTVGILLSQTDKYIVIGHDVELGSNISTYTKILKSTITNTTRYGNIELELEGGDVASA